MYTFPYKFENVNPLTFLDRFGILVRFSVFVRHYILTQTGMGISSKCTHEQAGHRPTANVKSGLMSNALRARRFSRSRLIVKFKSMVRCDVWVRWRDGAKKKMTF
jgi:hypothetical protein